MAFQANELREPLAARVAFMVPFFEVHVTDMPREAGAELEAHGAHSLLKHTANNSLVLHSAIENITYAAREYIMKSATATLTMLLASTTIPVRCMAAMESYGVI